MSVVGARIANSLFQNGGRDNPRGTPAGSRNTNSILALNGGCGAYEDYTEGPFSRDILIENNTFDHIAPDAAAAKYKIDPSAIVQFAGCRPMRSCPPTSAPTAPPPHQPYPLPQCEPGGSTQPPLQTHTGDDGPGRLVEKGQRLDSGQTIYANITIRGNRFMMGRAGSNAAFVDVGAADGIVVQANRMVRTPTVASGASTHSGRGGRDAAAHMSDAGGGIVVDVSTYSSRSFDVNATQEGNECAYGDKPVACVVSDKS
jgi:hypothetical protein